MLLPRAVVMVYIVPIQKGILHSNLLINSSWKNKRRQIPSPSLVHAFVISITSVCLFKRTMVRLLASRRLCAWHPCKAEQIHLFIYLKLLGPAEWQPDHLSHAYLLMRAVAEASVCSAPGPSFFGHWKAAAVMPAKGPSLGLLKRSQCCNLDQEHFSKWYTICQTGCVFDDQKCEDPF